MNQLLLAGIREGDKPEEEVNGMDKTKRKTSKPDPEDQSVARQKSGETEGRKDGKTKAELKAERRAKQVLE